MHYHVIIPSLLCHSTSQISFYSPYSWKWPFGGTCRYWNSRNYFYIIILLFLIYDTFNWITMRNYKINNFSHIIQSDMFRLGIYKSILRWRTKRFTSKSSAELFRFAHANIIISSACLFWGWKMSFEVYFCSHRHRASKNANLENGYQYQ